jgi:hypothetical protein
VVPLKKQLYALPGNYVQQKCYDDYVKVYKQKKKRSIYPSANYVLLALQEQFKPCGYKQS